jgi:predicted short-subunit dehydrogenase-like oxidoreductase (DUF2520 family)
MITFRVIGPGRAGQSLAAALDSCAGFETKGVLGRGDRLEDAASGVDLLVIATPDSQVAPVASSVVPVDSAVVIHLSGSLGLDVLAPHLRTGSVHPLVPLPDPQRGAERLQSGVTFAVAGDPLTETLVGALGGRAARVDDRDRDAYHAAAAIAANHMVALIGQVERVAAAAGLPLDAFSDLMHAALDDALSLGPRRALTGPAARGDLETVERHRKALASLPAHRSELAAYDAMVVLARRLAMGMEPEQGSGDPAEPAGSVARGDQTSGAPGEQVA